MLVRKEMLSVLREYKREYSERYGILEIGVFGSVARGEATVDSDVDICIKTKNPDPSNLVHIKADIEDRLQVPVDIIRVRENLIDAQLPKRLALWLAAQGYDAKHTLDLSIVLYNGEPPWTAQPDITDLVKPVPAGLMAGTARPTSKAFHRCGQPVVPVATKKKELIGDVKQGDREWQPVGHPEPVRVYDCIDPNWDKAIPDGGYDLTAHRGGVNVDLDHDPAALAAKGKPCYHYVIRTRSPYG